MPTGQPLHRSPQPGSGSRRRYLRPRYLWALPAVPALALAGVYVAMGPGGATATQAQDHMTVARPARSAASPGSVTDVQTASRCTSAGGSSTGSGSGTACSVGAMGIAKMPARPAARAHSAPSAAASASPTAPAPGAAPSSSPAPASSAPSAASPAQQGTPAGQVLGLINQARAQAGLPALTFSSGLNQSASQHNLTMASGCGLSHQCPGEPAIGDRETAAGVHWTAAGENIGEEGPVTDSTSAIAQAAVALTQAMLNEQPPDDGHRKNILSASFAHIGIAVYRDSSGTVWLTQDFSN